MSLRKRAARALRKWADLIDPHVSPAWQQNMVINLSCDASAFNASMEEVARKIKAARLGGGLQC